jgi:hypothetical protein
MSIPTILIGVSLVVQRDSTPSARPVPPPIRTVTLPVVAPPRAPARGSSAALLSLSMMSLGGLVVAAVVNRSGDRERQGC